MKIYNNVNKIVSLYRDNVSIDRASDNLNQKKDEVYISQAGKEISKYIEGSMNSEITSEKIESIRKSIMDNTYKIDTKELAKSILDEINGRSDK